MDLNFDLYMNGVVDQARNEIEDDVEHVQLLDVQCHLHNHKQS
jgi:hypothetical protein